MSIFIGNSEIKNAYIGTTSVKEIYVGATKVRPSGWKPGSNTLFYYPLVENANDTSGNNRNGTASNTTFSSSNGAYFRGGYSAGSNGYVITPTFTMGSTYTINTWLKAAETLSGNKEIDIHRRWTGGNLYVLFYISSSMIRCTLGNGSNYGSDIISSYSLDTSWHNVVLVREGGNVKIYIDGQQLASGNSIYSSDPQYFYIGNDASNIESYAGSSYFKDYIMEGKAWTAQEVSQYYSQTKSKYGL